VGGYADNSQIGAAWVFVQPGLPTLQVMPSSGIVSAGAKGGPFAPSSFQYQLSASVGSVDFSISGTPTWLNASFISGTLMPSQPLTVTFMLTAAAKSLAAGANTATIAFTNKTNGQGNTTRTATLTVNGPSPTCTLQVSPATINPGQRATLSWTSANATGGTIDNGIGSVGPKGSQTITPTQTTTYTGMFTGSVASANCQTTVTVSAPTPTCNLHVNPASIRQGDQATLSWNSNHAVNGTIDNDIGVVGPSGSTILYPTATTTYTGAFAGPGGSATCTATVTVTGNQKRVLGIDVSARGIVWNTFCSDGREFIVIEASVGTRSNIDFGPTALGAKNATCTPFIGAYHYAEPYENTAKDEADVFLASAGEYIGAGFLPPVIDIEDPCIGVGCDKLEQMGGEAVSQWIKDWCNYVTAGRNVPCMIYTTKYLARLTQPNNNAVFFFDIDTTKYPLWIAEDTSGTPEETPNKLGPWGNSWVLSQYATNIALPGVPNADLNAFNGDNGSLKNFVPH
jgi:GH25 family lysozyme M1 (1,4-beta-N-acetylmuramidase)